MSRLIDVEPILAMCDDPEVSEPYGIHGAVLERMMREAPIANRPQGEWLDTGKDPDHSHPLTAIWYKCSECGDGTNTKTNFCPNCGAKMKQ